MGVCVLYQACVVSSVIPDEYIHRTQEPVPKCYWPPTTVRWNALFLGPFLDVLFSQGLFLGSFPGTDPEKSVPRSKTFHEPQLAIYMLKCIILLWILFWESQYCSKN